MMEWLYGKKVFGGQLFVTCSLLLLAALSVAGAQVADVTPSLTACMLTPSMPMPGMAWFSRRGRFGSLPTLPSDLDRSARRLSMALQSSTRSGKSAPMRRSRPTAGCRGPFLRAKR